MQYKSLTPEQQQQISDNTLANIEANHYATKLTLDMAEASGRPTEPIQQELDALEAQREALFAHGEAEPEA